MPAFIPDWTRATAREVLIKRALQPLDAAHVIRRPLRLTGGTASCPADFFVQRGETHWLAVAIATDTADQLEPSQLFESPQRLALEHRLAALASMGASSSARMNTLVVLWTCSAEEASRVEGHCAGRFPVRFVSRDEFTQGGAARVERLLAPVPGELAQDVMLAYFPEAEIPAICTSRRFLHHGTDASLVRYFLDHQQEQAAKLDLDPPQEQAGTEADFAVRLVNGVAGSGKTLILLQRALLLCKLLPADRVLVLIHNAPVVADALHRLVRVHGALPAHLEVCTFSSWASRQWHAVYRHWPRIATRAELMDIVEPMLRGHPTIRLSAAQLLDEFQFIDDRMLVTEADYLEANRSGRRFSVRPAEREQVYQLYCDVTAMLRKRHWRTWSDVPSGLCLDMTVHARLPRYRHVLVDEAQFFAPSWFQLVKLSMAPGASLFLCADPTQGFLKNRLSWKAAGLQVAGRTRRLRKSYRTTRAILRAAQAVVAGLVPEDDDDIVQPDFDGMEEGSPPLLLRTDARQDSIDRVVNEVVAARSDAGLPLAGMLVIYGDGVAGADLYWLLCRRLGRRAVWWFNEASQRRVPPDDAQEDLLRMAYLDSATGLEGAVVFLVGAEGLLAGVAPLDMPDADKEQWRDTSARKLYMAMTRAGQRLVVVSKDDLPAPLGKVFELAPMATPGTS